MTNHEHAAAIIDKSNDLLRETARELGAAEYMRDRYKLAIDRIALVLERPGLKRQDRLALIDQIVREALP